LSWRSTQCVEAGLLPERFPFRCWQCVQAFLT
jgi:hypothetical protein